MPKKIVIVEDERDIAELVEHYLGKEGFQTEIVADGGRALERIRKSPPDLVVLDLMLPGMDGLEICRALRSEERFRAMPVIMLTARGGEADKVTGLEMGADDYVTKPFSPRELVARVRALLRRRSNQAEFNEPLQYGRLMLDPDRHVVEVGGKAVELTAKEFSLLKHLMGRRGRLVSRDHLLNAVWGYDYVGGSRKVDVHVRHLRRKIPMLAKALVTVKSFGYKLSEGP
jgi:DNA-binding response OmpR family regulator